MSADDQMPDRLGPYRLLDRIGEGGMGVVYLARDPAQRAVAVKVLRPGVAAEPTGLRRLAREVETMQRVRSPFVAEVIDADVVSDTPYIVTRYVPGQTLDQVIAAQGPLRGVALAGLARGLAEALAAVHAAGVVHRDLKPSNVMLCNGAPVVIDFGIAQGPEATRLTMTGMFMGTPGYLCPEVIEGQPSSEASDVHAWGATVAFAATGRPPFGTGSYETIFYKIVNGQPDLDGAPAPLLPLLAAALARDPAHRPAAVQLSALAAVLDPAALVAGPAAGGRQQLAGTAAQATRAEAAAGEPPAAAAGLAGGLAGWVPGGVPGVAAGGGADGWGAGGALTGGAFAAGDAFAGGGLAAAGDLAAAGGLAAGAGGGGLAAGGLAAGAGGGGLAAGGLAAGAGGGGLAAGGLAGGGVPLGAVRDSAVPRGAAPGGPVPGVAVPGSAGPGGMAPDGAAFGGEVPGGMAPGGAAFGCAGPGGAAAGGMLPGYGAGTQAIPAGLHPADFADVLPPVEYLPGARRRGGGPVPPGPAAGPGSRLPGDPPAVTASPRGHAVLAVATIVIFACVSVLLPVAGTAAALAVIALLRAGEAARRGAALRRSTRGARSTDPLVSAVAFPWFLIRSAIGLLLLAPFALATGALAAGLSMIAVHVDRLPHAIAYGTGALVAYYGLGPGSARPRGQLGHLYARLAPTRIAQAAALIAVVALAAGAVTAAVSIPPLYSPLQPPASLVHLGYGPLGGLPLLHAGSRFLPGR
jgi:hypothetical protein